jgi:NhaA family Na+:H+ antiporter
LIQPFLRFFRLEAAGGVLLFFAAVSALILANSSLTGWYSKLLTSHIAIGAGRWGMGRSVHFWINDAGMTLFFLLVGLEIKREVIWGELASLRSALLPLLAALGGVVTPALIYYALNHSRVTARGWGVPIATDVAFSLAILASFGKRIPAGLKVFLAAFAIVDDIAGVLVIAFAYTSTLHLEMIAFAGLCLGLCVAANIAGITRLWIYLVPSVLLWVCLLYSGIHPTLAGLLIAFVVPGGELVEGKRTQGKPLYCLERWIHPFVVFGIVPLFAFVNAGIPVRGIQRTDFLHPVFMGVYCGLLFGKPLGISLFAWLAVRMRVAQLPFGTTWRSLFAVSCLGGIGFTISIFIAGLAFGDARFYLVARMAILFASTTSALVGAILLLRTGREQPYSNDCGALLKR